MLVWSFKIYGLSTCFKLKRETIMHGCGWDFLILCFCFQRCLIMFLTTTKTGLVCNMCINDSYALLADDITRKLIPLKISSFNIYRMTCRKFNELHNLFTVFSLPGEYTVWFVWKFLNKWMFMYHFKLS